MLQERVFDGAFLRADLYGGGRRGLFVSFDHWRGPARKGFPDMGPVGPALGFGFASLVISTAADDWFSNPDLPAMQMALRGLSARFDIVRGIGFSMGGFGALLLGQSLRMSFVTLWSPQVGIGTQVAPWETRWRAEAGRIGQTQPLRIDQRLRGVVLLDPFAHKAERAQARAVQAMAPGLAIAALPFSGHPPTAVVMAGGAYGEVLSAAIHGRLDVATLRRLHRAHRWQSESYLRGLDAALARRDAQPLGQGRLQIAR